MPIRAVIFDLDCTLTCRASSLGNAARQIAQQFASHLSPDGLAELERALRQADHFGYRDRAAFFDEVLAAGCWTSKPTMEALLRFWADDFPRCAVAVAPAVSVLNQLRTIGLKLGLITNGSSRTQWGKIRYLGLDAHVDHVVVSGDLGYKKPDPRIFRHSVEALGLAPHEALYVGDHAENDVRGAQAAGLTSVWIATGGPWPGEMAPPNLRIGSLDELPALVARLGSDCG